MGVGTVLLQGVSIAEWQRYTYDALLCDLESYIAVLAAS